MRTRVISSGAQNISQLADMVHHHVVTDNATTQPELAEQLLHGSFSHTRTLRASPRAVFAAYSELALRRRWFRIPSDPESAHHELDFRVGGGEIGRGRFSAAGASEQIEYRSRFSEIRPDERIVLTYELVVNGRLRSVSLATVELAPQSGGTRLTYTEQYVFLALTGDGSADRAEREQGMRLQYNGLQAVVEEAAAPDRKSGAPDVSI